MKMRHMNRQQQQQGHRKSIFRSLAQAQNNPRNDAPEEERIQKPVAAQQPFGAPHLRHDNPTGVQHVEPVAPGGSRTVESIGSVVDMQPEKQGAQQGKHEAPFDERHIQPPDSFHQERHRRRQIFLLEAIA